MYFSVRVRLLPMFCRGIFAGGNSTCAISKTTRPNFLQQTSSKSLEMLWKSLGPKNRYWLYNTDVQASCCVASRSRWRLPHCVGSCVWSSRNLYKRLLEIFALRESTQHKALHHCKPALTHACMIIVHVRGCVVIGLPEARWPLFGYLSGTTV